MREDKKLAGNRNKTKTASFFGGPNPAMIGLENVNRPTSKRISISKL